MNARRYGRVSTAAALLLVASGVSGQFLVNTNQTNPGNYSGGGGAQTEVTFHATLQGGIVIRLDGISNGGRATVINGANAAGSVLFGPFDTMCTAPLLSGRCVRIPTPGGQRGNHLIASFRVSVVVSGGGRADVGISRDAAYGGASPPDIPVNYLKFASGLATDWSNRNAGTPLPDPLAPIGENNLGSNVLSGTSINHEVAMRFRDQSVVDPAGYMTRVRWTATTN